ncbi:MAG: ribosomal protein S18-alanine N-acetyltransferase [Clostridia bacterium]|nr:ribosomal protein S18-alanine N-acetyltransferase [Clostridia bacterium]
MKVIFVCSGNTCRSPMAEGYLKSKGLPITVESRGFMSDGDKVSHNSVTVMKEIGIDISAHLSKVISPDDLNADRLICMSNSHAAALINAGADLQKLSVLGGGIIDPFGSDTDAYRACRDNIISAIDKLIDDNFFSEFTVSKMLPDDIPEVARLEEICFSEPWSEKSILESLNAGTLFFVARIGDKICGYIGISIIAGEGYVTNVAVFPEYRSKGIGTALLKRVIALKNETALDFVSLEVRASNKVAISIYEKNDFKVEGLRKNFYRNPTEDAIIMTRRF